MDTLINLKIYNFKIIKLKFSTQGAQYITSNKLVITSKIKNVHFQHNSQFYVSIKCEIKPAIYSLNSSFTLAVI